MRLPPDKVSLNLHIMHVNYLTYIQRHPELRNHPSPIRHGWVLINGHCRPIRYTDVDLPAKIIPHPSKEQMIQSVSYIYLNQTCCCYKDHSCDVLDAIEPDTDSFNVFY